MGYFKGLYKSYYKDYYKGLHKSHYKDYYKGLYTKPQNPKKPSYQGAGTRAAPTAPRLASTRSRPGLSL